MTFLTKKKPKKVIIRSFENGLLEIVVNHNYEKKVQKNLFIDFFIIFLQNDVYRWKKIFKFSLVKWRRIDRAQLNVISFFSGVLKMNKFFCCIQKFLF